MKTLRDYQSECVEKIYEYFARVHSAIAVLPTGAGKTVICSAVIRQWPERNSWTHGNVLFLAHRKELIEQTAKAIDMEIGCRPYIEMGERGAETETLFSGDMVVVGSVQSMVSQRRLDKYKNYPFGLIIIDECHHSTASSYTRILDYFRKLNPDLRLLGVTATPNRADETALGLVFEEVAFQRDIHWMVDQGYLVPFDQQTVTVTSLDLDSIKVVRKKNEAASEADFNREQLEEALTEDRTLHEMATPILRETQGMQAIIFTAGVKHAHRLAEILNGHESGCAAAIDGDQSRRAERDCYVEEYRKGNLRFLLNFGVLCLDEETEILTSRGWVGIDDMTYEHEIANWEHGEIYFEPPKFIVRRHRLPGEKMVVLETPRRSIRVTEDHRMLYRTYSEGQFRIKHASELVGKMVELPVSGNAQCLQAKIEQPKAAANSMARVRANSYALRKNGMKPQEAKAEAIKRIAERNAIRYTDPAELSLEDCEFIGFWIGDGSVSRLKSGGVEYTLSQSPKCPKIVARIDWLLEKINVDYIKRITRPNKRGEHYRWSIPRGTGFGSQKRNGLFRLEPYLQKSGTRLFWSLDDNQFAALLRGLWMADGDHGDNIKPPKTLNACGINSDLFDLLQAVGVCRGYRISLRAQKARQSHYIPLIKFSARKADSHLMTKYCLQFESGWKDERVWCVTSTSGNIVTRRKGSVTVTGNTEGFDAPATGAVVTARPTRSVGTFTQMVGRGLRPLPGLIDGLTDPFERRMAILTSSKPRCLVLDFVGATRNGVVDCYDVLGGNYDVEVRQLASEHARTGSRVNVTAEDLELAQNVLALRRALAARQQQIVVESQYFLETADTHAGNTGNLGDRVRRGGASDQQVTLLIKLGVSRDRAIACTKAQAGAMIDSIGKTRCTQGQAAILRKNGIDPKGIGMERAKQIIQQIADNGWRVPPGGIQ